MEDQKKRVENDTFGPIEVPQDAYYGAQTARSLVYFRIGHETMPLSLIRAFAIIKKSAAEANQQLGLIPQEIAVQIIQAADEVIAGKHDAHFPLSVWQTGSGTQTNMNVNEVIANRAIELSGGVLGSKSPVHPNDHVNCSQSSNDTFPTAMHIAVVEQLSKNLLPNLAELVASLEAKCIAFKELIKIGRTHLMDAVPVTLGQEFSGYVSQLKDDQERIQYALKGLYPLALGGTAVGTGLNTVKPFAQLAAERIAENTGFPFVSASNKFAALACHDPIVFVSGALKTLSVSLFKIARDIAWMGSGPSCGLQELILPANEPGSSIMPGKVNPTQCEAISMVTIQVMGYDAAIGFAGALGNFELNVYKPLILYNTLNAIHLLSDAMLHFRKYLVDGLLPNERQLKENVERSLMLVTALAPKIGYDAAAKVAKKALYDRMTLKEAAVSLGVISSEEFDRIVVPRDMLHPQ